MTNVKTPMSKRELRLLKLACTIVYRLLQFFRINVTSVYCVSFSLSVPVTTWAEHSRPLKHCTIEGALVYLMLWVGFSPCSQVAVPYTGMYHSKSELDAMVVSDNEVIAHFPGEVGLSLSAAKPYMTQDMEMVHSMAQLNLLSVSMILEIGR